MLQGGKDVLWHSLICSTQFAISCPRGTHRHTHRPLLLPPARYRPSPFLFALDTVTMKSFAALVGASALLLSRQVTEAMGVEPTCRPRLRRVAEVAASSPPVNTAKGASEQVETPENNAQPYLRGSGVGGGAEGESEDEPEPEAEPEPEGEDEEEDGDVAECTMEDLYKHNASEISVHTSAAIHDPVPAIFGNVSSAVEESILVYAVVTDGDKSDSQVVAHGAGADIDSGDDEIDGPVSGRGAAANRASHVEEAMRGASGRRQPARESWQLGGYRSVPSRAVFHERYLVDPYSVGGDFILDPDFMGAMGRRGRGPTQWAEFRRW